MWHIREFLQKVAFKDHGSLVYDKSMSRLTWHCTKCQHGLCQNWHRLLLKHSFHIGVKISSVQNFNR